MMQFLTRAHELWRAWRTPTSVKKMLVTQLVWQGRRWASRICSSRPLLPCACPSAAAVGPAMEYGIPKRPYFCHTPCFREYPRLFSLAYIKALRHALNLHLAVLQNLCCQTSLFPKQCLMKNSCSQLWGNMYFDKDQHELYVV